MTCGALGEARVSSVVGREVRGWRVWGCWVRLAFILCYNFLVVIPRCREEFFDPKPGYKSSERSNHLQFSNRS